MRRLNTKKKTRKLSKGIITITASFNNTIISLTNLKGDVLAWSSGGTCGFRGARKGTPFAAKTAIDVITKKAVDQGIKNVRVIVRGPGPGRETATRSLQTAGLQILLMRDQTTLAHNGCRPPKKRRV